MKISAVIIAFNEEDHIADAIRSVEFVDEVIVIDSESTDRTREIAAELDAKVIVQPWLGFGKQKQFATDRAKYDRILSIDADERISEELKKEILSLKDDDVLDGYRIPRLTTYTGYPIRHGGWYPDRQLRFFDRRKGRWKDLAVHESVEMFPGASVGKLKSDILHCGVETAAEHLEMIRSRYAPLGAQVMYDRGESSSLIKLLLYPVASFVRQYVFRAGILDGLAGFRIAWLSAYHVYLKRRLHRGMQDTKEASTTT